MDRIKNSTGAFNLLSQLLLAGKYSEEVTGAITSYSSQEFGGLWGLATSHHLIMRAFPP
jgi:hypothetical protein